MEPGPNHAVRTARTPDGHCALRPGRGPSIPLSSTDPEVPCEPQRPDCPVTSRPRSPA